MRLIAAHHHRSGRFGRADVGLVQARVDRTRHALLPLLVEDRDSLVEGNGSADRSEVCTQYHEHWRCAGLFGDANRALQESLAGIADKLFGLAKAAARSRGENDGSYRHL